MKAQVFRSLDEAHGAFGPCALTVGNFDGVHLGHQALLEGVREFARSENAVPAALTFDPHPAFVVAPERTPLLICSLEERIHCLAEAGAERILVLPFTRELAQTSAQQFVSDVLVKALEAKAIVVGENFRFGHRHAGTPETLKELAPVYGFHTRFIQSFRLRGEVVSSSAIRKKLNEGEVSCAGRMLGRCFSISGRVVRGHGIGSKQTVPTLNLKPPEGRVIPRGVYISETQERASGRRWISVTNAGVRPTFEGERLTIETFLLDPLDGEPPDEIEVRFWRYLRAERKFADAADLKTQILRDVGKAKAFWRRMRLY